MTDMILTQPHRPIWMTAFFQAMAAILAVAAIIGGIAWWNMRGSGKIAAEIAMPQVEERYGVRITQVAVTAEGGFVDFRFQVLDPSKLMDMMETVETMPILVMRDGHTLKANAPMEHKTNFQAGRQYWMLYYNTGNIIKPGDVVTMRIGEIEIKNLRVQ